MYNTSQQGLVNEMRTKYQEINLKLSLGFTSNVILLGVVY